MNLKPFYLIVLVSTIPLAFGDQQSPHMRCADNEKMTWSEELQQHDCIETTFVIQESETCKKDIYFWNGDTVIKESSTDYIWVQTGYSSYEQVECNIPVTKIVVDLDHWDLWEQYAWDFVFSGRFGF